MTSSRILFAVSLLVLTSLLVVVPVTVGLADAPTRSPSLSQFQPGNYCVSCHTPGDGRLASVMAWTGGIDRDAENISPCSAASRVREEVYYTDRMLLAIDRARSGLPNGVDTSGNDARVAASRQTYSRLLDTPVTSLDAVTSEAQVLRYRLGKNYTWLNQVRDALKRRLVLIVAVCVTLILLISLGWGLRNVAQFIAARGRHGSRRLRLSLKAIFFVVLVFLLFSLPVFRIPSQVVESSEDALARQAALDTADRAADVAERALARAWMLARVGAAWSDLNPQRAESALADALAAAEETQLNTAALWGEAQAVQEGTVDLQFAQEKAWLSVDRLNSVNSRAWALGLIADEWASVDPTRTEEILEEALTVATGRASGIASTDIYRDFDVRIIAVIWATLDPEQGLAVAERIHDPAVRAWALREIAEFTGDASLYAQAAEVARLISDPVDRARVLREIAVSSGDHALFNEALAALEGVESASRAYALSDLAAASGDASVAAQIEPGYPGARAAALYRIGQFDEAWAAAGEIEDPFDRARAQAAIASAWGNADAAMQISDPTLRDLALREVAVAKQDLSLAGSIESPYYRVQALTALGQYQAALEAAAELKDTYPLRALAVAWAATDPQSALTVVDIMDREVDKAAALHAIAVATHDDELFERALGMALAARLQGDTLSPAQASLDLGQDYKSIDTTKAEAALDQAYDVTLGISTKYK
jgi:tetratricopeptide (TPR) repeat protein